MLAPDRTSALISFLLSNHLQITGLVAGCPTAYKIAANELHFALDNLVTAGAVFIGRANFKREICAVKLRVDERPLNTVFDRVTLRVLNLCGYDCYSAELVAA
jgi:hypothetical protein